MSRNKFSIFTVMALFLFTTMLFGGCGGGGGGGSSSLQPGSSTKTGVFIDGPVEGLGYVATPSGKSGFTNANGHFEFVAGDTIVFKVGGISLPPIPAQNVITPFHYVPGSAFDADNPEAAVLNFVRFMLYVGDVDANGNIKIQSPLPAPFDGVTEAYDDFADLWTDYGADIGLVVSEQDAKDHLGDYLMVSYAGVYKGTYSGSGVGNGVHFTEVGTWKAEIDSKGKVLDNSAAFLQHCIDNSINIDAMNITELQTLADTFGLKSYFIGTVSQQGMSFPNAGFASGSVNVLGTMIATADGAAGFFWAKWEGTINLATGNILEGTYSTTGVPNFSQSGSFSGSRTGP